MRRADKRASCVTSRVGMELSRPTVKSSMCELDLLMTVSSNGRTRGFHSLNRGSIPLTATISEVVRLHNNCIKSSKKYNGGGHYIHEFLSVYSFPLHPHWTCNPLERGW